jgi:hypothetical protein
MKKNLAFYTCSNGLGHFSRVLKISEYLLDTFNITIYCEKFQHDKFKPDINVDFIFYDISNIRWDKTLKENKVDFESYFKWCHLYGPTCLKYDYVVSDNLAGLLKFRKDIILSGSFFWKDVFFKKFKDNKLSEFDSFYIDHYKPVVLTNKYLETESIKKYKNKVQFGFGCKNNNYTKPKSYEPIAITPSLDYLLDYNLYMKNLPFEATENIQVKDNCIYIIRPGVGMITHCIENNIPIVALYSKKDSSEIIELANKVEKLNIGFKQNIAKKFNIKKYNNLMNEDIYNKVTFDKNGYKNIANYLKNL